MKILLSEDSCYFEGFFTTDVYIVQFTIVGNTEKNQKLKFAGLKFSKAQMALEGFPLKSVQ